MQKTNLYCLFRSTFTAFSGIILSTIEGCREGVLK
nr:MAG TPA: hypothetical protein [Caudoviricetes sp.]